MPSPQTGVALCEEHAAEQGNWLAQTFEQSAEEDIQNLRERMNTLEAALARAPVQIRRMTRAQAQKLGIHF